jgi:hypothetical protein
MASLVLLPFGCGGQPVPDPPDEPAPAKTVPDKKPLPNTGRVKLHVKDMCKRLNIS